MPLRPGQPHACRQNALTAASSAQVRVVILGQDPYHAKGQAEGLCFSGSRRAVIAMLTFLAAVPKGVAVPSSLRNIYKELADDIPGFTKPKHGSNTACLPQP